MRSSPKLPSLEHVVALSDDTGIIQHAVETIPNRSTGYCIDDISRAFIVALARLRLEPRDPHAMRLASTYLSFMHDAQLEDGRFHNFMSYDRKWLDDVGTHDSVGRAMWAIGYGVRYAPTAQWRRVCRRLFDRGLQSLDWLEFLRPKAFAMLGLAHAIEANGTPADRAALRTLADALHESYVDTRDAGWEWFEQTMTYDNARLPEALLRAGVALQEPSFVDGGLRTLDFCEHVTIEDGIFVPIGNEGWYTRGRERSRFAQQPLEAAAMVDAELAAFAAAPAPGRLAAAETALAWFYGRNLCGVTMAQGGGCFDGLEASDVNRNMGAESTLAYLAGAYALAEHRAATIVVARGTG
jgi:hypothetical protein